MGYTAIAMYHMHLHFFYNINVLYTASDRSGNVLYNFFCTEVKPGSLFIAKCQMPPQANEAAD